MEPRQPQFLHTQGPVGRRELRPATQILRAGNILPSPRGNPRNGGSRGRLPLSGGDVERSETEGVGTGGMEAGGSAEPPIAPAPWRFFGDFLGVQKVTRRRGGETPLQETKPLYHRPLIRHGFAVPPSPQGEGF